VRVILANGCFDVLHYGHVLHLQEAKALGGSLIVALTVDQFVNKGPDRPINSWKLRAAVLRELRSVDGVIESDSCVDAILRIKPAIFVKGVDYLDSPLLDAAKDACKEVGAEWHITQSPKYSSTGILGIINEIRNRKV